MINQSVHSAVIPLQYKSAVIKPVAKIPHPLEPADHHRTSSVENGWARSGSNVHLLGVPEDWNIEMHRLIADQCASCPSESTCTEPVIMMLQQLSRLHTNENVSIIPLDCSKTSMRSSSHRWKTKLVRMDITHNINKLRVICLLARQHVKSWLARYRELQLWA